MSCRRVFSQFVDKQVQIESFYCPQMTTNFQAKKILSMFSSIQKKVFNSNKNLSHLLENKFLYWVIEYEAKTQQNSSNPTKFVACCFTRKNFFLFFLYKIQILYAMIQQKKHFFFTWNHITYICFSSSIYTHNIK